MLCFWSAKGGAGCSVTAAAAALLAAEHVDTLLVDLVGDQAAVLGLAPHPGPGLGKWLSRPEPPPPDALARLERHVSNGLRLLSVDRTEPPALAADRSRLELLAYLLAAEHRLVVVDLGRWAPAWEPLVVPARSRILVTRLCYLALRAAADGPTPTGVVVVAEPGRALSCADVTEVTDAPVVARVPVDPAVARIVDAGLLAGRLPRPLRRLSCLVPGSSS